MSISESTERGLSYAEWCVANRLQLAGELNLLKLKLQRHVLWLRTLWADDPLQKYPGQVISDTKVDHLLHSGDIEPKRMFFVENSDARKVSRRIVKSEKELDSQADLLRKSGSPTALDVMSHLFGLTDTEREILLLCLAPELDTSFERLYAYVQDDATRKYATTQFVISLLAEDIEKELAIRQSLQPDSPLVRYRLIQWDNTSYRQGSRASAPVHINQRVANYLQGINHVDKTLAGAIVPVPPAEALPTSYEEIVGNIRRVFQSGNKDSLPPPLVLTGPARVGKRDIASRLYADYNLALYQLRLQNIGATGEDRHDIIPVIERECLLLPAGLYLDVADVDDADVFLSALKDDIIERLRAFLIIASDEPVRTNRTVLTLAVPRLTPREQSDLWEKRLRENGISPDGRLDAIIEQFDLESDMIGKVVTSAKMKACMQSDGSGSVCVEDIWRSGRDQCRSDMRGRAQRIAPCYTWDDIVLPDDVLEQLKDIAGQVMQRGRVYEEWGFGAKMSRGRGISALFSGPSGTGKTMAAEIIANHLHLDLYRIDLSAVVSKYIGETEKNLRHVFDAAEQSGAILFFDEADALFGKRSEVKDSHDRYANIEINYLLQRMEEYRGIAILATNMKSLLDSAFLRRLRFHVEFPFPEGSHRRRIWQKVFPPETTVRNLDYGFLVRLEIPGACIKNIALNAAFLAANDGQAIEMNHILRATKREYAKIGKMLLESEFGHYYKMVTP